MRRTGVLSINADGRNSGEWPFLRLRKSVSAWYEHSNGFLMIWVRWMFVKFYLECQNEELQFLQILGHLHQCPEKHGLIINNCESFAVYFLEISPTISKAQYAKVDMTWRKVLENMNLLCGGRPVLISVVGIWISWVTCWFFFLSGNLEAFILIRKCWGISWKELNSQIKLRADILVRVVDAARLR